MVTNQDAIETWMQKDVDARTYLYSTIKTEQQGSLHGCSTAFQMWTRIQTEYAQVMADNEHLITAKFFAYKYVPSHSVMAHVAAIEQMAAHLKDLSAPISDVQVMSKILLTLPPSYRHFLSAWDSVPSNERTIKLLTSRLVKEEIRTQQYNDGESDPADLAFFGDNSGQPNKSGEHYVFSDRGRGYRGARGDFRGHRDSRGRKGHHGTDRGGYHAAGREHRSGVMCDYCHRHGHSGAVCRMKARHERERMKATKGENEADEMETSDVTNEAGYAPIPIMQETSLPVDRYQASSPY